MMHADEICYWETLDAIRYDLSFNLWSLDKYFGNKYFKFKIQL